MAEANTTGLLLGWFRHALDPKRRVTIPAEWRELMGSPARLYVMPDVNEYCLNVFAPSELEPRLERLRQRSVTDARAAAFARRLGEVSECVSVDVQGRIRVCDRLLRHARLRDKVILVGAINRIELWSPELKPEEEEIELNALAEASRGVDF